MININNEEERFVFPKWRSFGKTIALGELDSFNQNKLHKSKKTDVIKEYIIDFELNQSNIYASELLSAAISNGLEDEEEVIKAAKFIKDSKNKITVSQKSLSETILSKNINPYPEKCLTSLDLLKELDESKDRTREKIREIKKKLFNYFKNPILHVELSRYYLLLGQKKSAIKSIRYALNLGPTNRFVLRCAAKLSEHFSDNDAELLEEMRRILNKHSIATYDPWLLSAEIAISSQLNRTSRFIKKGMEFIKSNSISPFSFTELASSIATVEMEYGSHKNSRALFNQALISPNDNSFAQIEWAAQKDKNIKIPSLQEVNIKKNFEALAMGNYHSEKYDFAVSHMVEWLLDQPFSKAPSITGSYIASTFTKDYKTAINLSKAGLISHPDDVTLNNNLAYALALDENPQAALKILDSMSGILNIPMETQICQEATRGLAMFKLGTKENISTGRKLYESAINKAIKESNDNNFISLAILNYVRAEIFSPHPNFDSALNAILKVSNDNIDSHIKNLKKDILKEFNIARDSK